jgi:hypothetical protein
MVSLKEVDHLKLYGYELEYDDHNYPCAGIDKRNNRII